MKALASVWRSLPGRRFDRTLFLFLLLWVLYSLARAVYMEFSGDPVGAFLKTASTTPAIVGLAWIDLSHRTQQLRMSAALRLAETVLHIVEKRKS